MSNNNIAGFPVGDRAATKTPEGQNPAVVAQQIAFVPYNRRKGTDLTDWRNANKAAEGIIPRRAFLYDLYHDYGTTDGQILAVWPKRVEPIQSATWEFTDKDGNIVEEIQQLIDCIGFDDLLATIMESKRDGYKMCEPTFFVNDNGQHEFSLYVVPLKNMRPEKGVIAYDHVSDNGINIREGIYAKTVMEFGKTDDLGLMLSACMYAILKRGDISDWAEFIEIFGRGIIDATWDGFDIKQRQDLARTIQEMGGGGVIIRPAGTTVDIKNNTGNATGALQDTFATKMDAYISKIFLGTTETTDSSKSSGYAQSETHQDQQNQKGETDLNFVRRNLNSRFIKVLKAAGFDTKGGTFVLKQKKRINKEAFEIHKSMRNDLKVPIDDDFFYEEYGVRKPDNYDELKKAITEAKNEDLTENPDKENAPTPPASGKKKDKKPVVDDEENSTKLSLFRRILRLFHQAPAPAQQPIAGAHQCGNHHTVKLAAFVAEKVFNDLAEGLIKRAWEAKGKLGFDAELFKYTATTLTVGFINGWRNKPVKLYDLGFDYDFDDPVALTAYEMNLFRFAGVKTLYDAQQLNELFRSSKSFREFYDTASSMLKVHNRQWLETEYNTAMATGEAASTYARLMKQVEIFPYWQYKTVGDEKVRHSHMLLHDIVLPWNSPLWRYIMPPNDWNCRCFIVPRTKAEVTKEQIKASEAKVKAYINSEAFKKAAKGGWGINRANKGMVFTENQHYATDYLGAINKLNKLDHTDYRIQDLKTLIRDATDEISTRYTKGADQRNEAIAAFFEGLDKASTKRYILKDVGGRDVTIQKSTVTAHTTDKVDKYAERHMYLELMPDILKKPDEIWLGNYGNSKLNNYVYIKYYKGTAVAVVARLKDDLSLEIETWYPISDESLRKGLLIKTPDVKKATGNLPDIVRELSYKRINKEADKLISSRVAELMDEYPKATVKTFYGISKNIAQANGRGNMGFNPAYFNDLDNFEAVLKNSVANLHFHKATTIKGIIDHEFGHILTLAELPAKKSTPFKDELTNIFNRYKKALTKKTSEGISWADNPDFVSKYSHTNLAEFAAESFAYALADKNASPFAKEVFNLINKYFK